VRRAERSSAAAVRTAVDMVDEGLISVEEALERVPLAAMLRKQAPVIARGQRLDVLARGRPWLPGVAAGRAVFTAEAALSRQACGEDVVLVKEAIEREDLPAVVAAQAVVTVAEDPGLMAGTLAVATGRPIVRDAGPLALDAGGTRAVVEDGTLLEEGAMVSVDGDNGLLIAGRVKLVPAQPDPYTSRLLDWCDERARLRIAPAAPAGWAVVRGPSEAATLTTRSVLIDLSAIDHDPAALQETATAALGAGVEQLGVRLGDMPRGGDFELPPGPWTLVVAAGARTWAARLLAARATQLVAAGA
jgi:pyruvate,orthophosphate dikinase